MKTKAGEEITKDSIERSDLNYSMLRQVIIRADFTSMLDADRMTADLNDQEWFRGAFNNYSRLRFADTLQPQGNGHMDMDSREEWSPRFIRRFDDCNIGAEKKVLLDITNESICMVIQCDDKYESIDDYLSLVINTLHFIISRDQYVKIRRLAIRKFDGEHFREHKEADNVFEYFDQRIMFHEKGDRFWQRSYTDNFIYGETGVKVNYTRTVKTTPKEEERLVFILDIDTSLDSELIKNERPCKEELESIFNEELNETAFDLFKRGVKLEFLLSKLK